MTDFTKKGTKLPVIPVGTKFKWLENETDFKEPSPSNINGFNSDNHDFISLGKFKHKKQTYVICDSEDIGHSSLRYLIKLSTIERLAKEQGMYKSQQMNPKVTLQENGDVIISNTVSNPTDKGFTITTTTTLSKVTVDEICRLVKEQPKPLVKLETCKWYQLKTHSHVIAFYEKDNDKGSSSGYGFNDDGIFEYDDSWCFKSRPNDWQPASPETVEQYLREEAVKRGFNGKLKFKPIGSHLEVIRDGNENTFGFDESLNQLLYCNYVIFRDGQWATIINPKTITKAEAEKELGKVITD